MKKISSALLGLTLMLALVASAYAETKSCCGSSCCNGQSCCRNAKK